MGWTYLDEQRTKKKRTPNVRNVQTTNAHRMHSVLSRTLSHVQNVEHVQNLKSTPAYLCEPLRTANEYNLRQTCHERKKTYANVYQNFQKRRHTLALFATV